MKKRIENYIYLPYYLDTILDMYLRQSNYLATLY